MKVFNSLYLNIRRFFHLIGVNRAVFFGVLSKVWLALAGIVTIFVIARYFSPEVQGYYFTFYSLLALQVFVELGLGAVIVSFASHEWSRLGFDEGNKIIGSPDALSRLKSLVKVVFRWYFVGAVILCFGLGLSGYIFFSNSPQVGVSWIAPWFTLCFLTSLNLGLTPSLFLLEGCNQVSQVYFYRFIHGIVRSFSIWIIMILGGGLWAAAGATFFPLIWALIFLLKRYFNFFKTLFTPISGPEIHWWNEIWPMQWRIAVSWLSGYFFFWFFIPVLFHFKGAIAAGQLGMTWRMVDALSMIASMWIITRRPQFGMMIAKKEYRDLDRLLFRSTILAIGIACCGAIVIFSFILVLYAYNYPLAERFLSPFPTAFFLLATILMQVSYGQSTYLRAHKREPFMVLSVISSILMAVLTLITASKWGALGISISYFSIIAFFGIPYGTIIWARCRKSWHYEDLIEPEIMQAEGAQYG